MQRLKNDIRKDIVEAATRMFADKGYLKASMRDIAKEAGVALSNIYNYFRSKDELFRHVVKPAMVAFDRLLDAHHGRRGVDIMQMRSDDYFMQVVEEYTALVTSCRCQLRLLFFRAQGSSVENYRKDFTNRSTDLVKRYFADMKHRHPQIETDISDFSIRMHTIWMFALLEELVLHDVGREYIRRVVTEYMTIEMAGWRELMRL